MNPPSPPVVVGVDGGPPALHAVAWAAREADRRHLPVHLVAVLPDDGTDPAAARRAHEDLIAARRAALATAAVITSTEVATGNPAAVLARRSYAATLVVIGSDGEAQQPGTVGSALVVDGACPIIVVPARWDLERHVGEVVVAVDPAGDAALRRTTITAAAGVARTWRRPLLVAVVLPGPQTAPNVGAARRVFDTLPGDVGSGVTVHEVLSHGDPADELLALTGPSTGLLAVGASRRGPGDPDSVGRAVLRRARCPVAVVPAAATLPFVTPVPATPAAFAEPV